MAVSKEKIMQGATKCFERFGYSKTTLDDIGKSVGLKKNSLYHYFKNKDDIFFEVVKHEAYKDRIEYEEKVNKASGIKNKIITYIKFILQCCERQTVLKTILCEVWSMNHPLTEPISKLFKENGISYVKSLLDEAYKNKEIIKYDNQKFAESIIMLYEAAKQKELQSEAYSSDENLKSDADDNIIFIIETMLKGLMK